MLNLPKGDQELDRADLLLGLELHDVPLPLPLDVHLQLALFLERQRLHFLLEFLHLLLHLRLLPLQGLEFPLLDLLGRVVLLDNIAQQLGLEVPPDEQLALLPLILRVDGVQLLPLLLQTELDPLHLRLP